MFCSLIPGKLIRIMDLLKQTNKKKIKQGIWPTESCLNDWRGPSLLETPHIPKSIHVKVALAVSSWEAGGVPSPLSESSLYNPCFSWQWERWQEAAGCTVLTSESEQHSHPANGWKMFHGCSWSTSLIKLERPAGIGLGKLSVKKQ